MTCEFFLVICYTQQEAGLGAAEQLGYFKPPLTTTLFQVHLEQPVEPQVITML